MSALVRRVGGSIARHLPAVLFIWAFGFCAFFYGYLVGDNHWFPYQALDSARVAAWMIHFKMDNGRIREMGAFTDIEPGEGRAQRIVAEQEVRDDADFLLTGGEGQYLEYCPEHGCAAVILRRDGSLVHAYPYRPDELSTKRTMELPYQEIMHDDAKDTAVFGIAQLPHGDLVVVYDYQGTSPTGGGISRIDKNGHIVWYRRDYSDHWPTVTEAGEILVVSHTIEDEEITIKLARKQSFTLACPCSATSSACSTSTAM